MSDKPETVVGLFVSQLNAKLADDYRNQKLQLEEAADLFDNLAGLLQSYSHDVPMLGPQVDKCRAMAERCRK